MRFARALEGAPRGRGELERDGLCARGGRASRGRGRCGRACGALPLPPGAAAGRHGGGRRARGRTWRCDRPGSDADAAAITRPCSVWMLAPPRLAVNAVAGVAAAAGARRLLPGRRAPAPAPAPPAARGRVDGERRGRSRPVAPSLSVTRTWTVTRMRLGKLRTIVAAGAGVRLEAAVAVEVPLVLRDRPVGVERPGGRERRPACRSAPRSRGDRERRDRRLVVDVDDVTVADPWRRRRR